MERGRKRAEERMTLRHKQSKWSKGMKDSGRTVWDEEAQNSAVEMAKRSEELRMRVAGKAILGEDEELESSGDEGDDLFNQDRFSYPQRPTIPVSNNRTAVSLGYIFFHHAARDIANFHHNLFYSIIRRVS